MSRKIVCLAHTVLWSRQCACTSWSFSFNSDRRRLASLGLVGEHVRFVFLDSFWLELGRSTSHVHRLHPWGSVCYAVVAASVFWSTSMISCLLLLQPPRFKQVCSVETKAQRRQRILLTARRQWMREEKDFRTPKDFDVLFSLCKGDFTRVCAT